jgi:hypothetical protein
MDIKNELEETIQSLALFFENNSKEQNALLIEDLDKKFEKNESLYDSEISLAYLNFTKFAAMPWLNRHPKVTNGWEKYYIECIYNGLLPHFVRKVIEKNEGIVCSGDKEHFIINKIKESVATGENISLYQTYEGCESINKDKWTEQAYWSPKSFKDTDEVKTKFKNWYNIE